MDATRIRGAKVLGDGRVVVGWIELAAVGLIVLVYVALPHGDPNARLGAATAHARQLVAWESLTALRWEPFVQRLSLGVPLLVAGANVFYGSLHFVVTAGTFLWLYRRHPDGYPDWRNAMAVTSVLSLLVFAVWPVLPPRLFVGPGGLHVQDTLTTHPSLWSFAGPMGSVANQLAAMPSVHCAWATIVAAVVVPRAQHRSTRLIAAVYPVLTAYVVIATGNHYVLDVVGGVAVAALGRFLACAGHRWVGAHGGGVGRSHAGLRALDDGVGAPGPGVRLRR